MADLRPILRRDRGFALAGTALGLAMAMQFTAAIGLVFAKNPANTFVPSGAVELLLAMFAAVVVNLLAAFLLAGSEAAGSRADDPEAPMRAMHLRALGVSCLILASPSWAWLGALLAIAALVPGF